MQRYATSSKGFLRVDWISSKSTSRRRQRQSDNTSSCASVSSLHTNLEEAVNTSKQACWKLIDTKTIRPSQLIANARKWMCSAHRAITTAQYFTRYKIRSYDLAMPTKIVWIMARREAR